jgi:hypothetical protein
MSAQRAVVSPRAVTESGAIPLDAYRPARRFALRQMAKVAMVFAVCVLGLIGSFADSAVARSSLLLIGAPADAGDAGFDSIAATLAWAAIADIAVCAGVVLVGFCLLSRPSAQVVPLHPRRRRP